MIEEHESLDYQVVGPEKYKQLEHGFVRLITETPRLVGYWTVREYDGDSKEIYTNGSRLPDPRDSVDTHWDSDERLKVIHYLETGAQFQGYFGYSCCRMGCAGAPKEMGNHDLTDGVWIYPEGYSHYLKLHDVKPPEAFLEHIRKNHYKQPKLEVRVHEYKEVTEDQAEAAAIAVKKASKQLGLKYEEEIGRKYEKEIRKINEIQMPPKKPWWRFW